MKDPKKKRAKKVVRKIEEELNIVPDLAVETIIIAELASLFDDESEDNDEDTTSESDDSDDDFGGGDFGGGGASSDW